MNISAGTIRRLAASHGFDACGISRVALRPKYLARYAEWVAKQRFGCMRWMAEPTRLGRRCHPEAMLAGVQSVISLAMRHSPPAYGLEEALRADGRGVIAAYAHGMDYHEIMKKRLKAFAGSLDRLLGPHEQRVYVDTAPVLEHAFAEQSGLAWQGKHSLNLNRSLGSWFLLGEVFTTARLPADEPASAHCGSCTACMDICPTRAIVSPFVVDARRCIAYLTIEYRGMIPHDLRALIGNRIYGCDDCQMVCPWNAKLPALKGEDPLRPQGENCLPDLASLLRLSEAGFRARFRKSPIRRTGRAAFLRNVCIALGNQRHARALDALCGALADAEALVRAHAAWAIGRLHVPLAARAGLLERALQQEQNDDVRREIRLALEHMD